MSRLGTCSPLLEAIGFSVAKRRMELGLSQEELATKAGVHRTYISDVERGVRNVSILTLERIASAMDLPLGVLFIFGSPSMAITPQTRTRLILVTWLTRAIGKALRNSRYRAQLSLAGLSAASGLSVCKLGKLERGATDVDVLTLECLVSALNTSLAELTEQAYRLDDERVLFIGPVPLSTQLNRPFRHVLTADSPGALPDLLNDWRADCLVVVNPQPLVLAEIEHQLAAFSANPLRRIRLCVLETGTEYGDRQTAVHCSEDQLVVTVDNLIAETHRGKICSLRRQRQDYAQRREALHKQQERLLLQSQMLAGQIERVSKIEAGLQQAASAANGKAAERALLKQLTARAVKLQTSQQQLKRQQQSFAEQDRFMNRREDKLVADVMSRPGR